jgi:hypothetical protein
MASRLETIRGEVNPILSKLAKGYNPPDQYIAKKVAPVVESLTESGTLFSFGKEGFMLYDTERALRANSKKLDFAISKDTFVTKEHSMETSLDYAELDAAEKIGAAQVLNLKKIGMAIVQRALNVELEYLVAAIMFSSTYYASGNYETLTGTDQWSHSSSKPIDKIIAAKKTARADMGIEPNTLILGYDAYYALANHVDIKAMVSSQRDKPIVLDASDLAGLLKFKSVFVGQAAYSTDAGVWTDIWGDAAALIYLPDSAELVEGTTPHTVIIEEMGYPQVREYAAKNTVDMEVKRKYTVKNIDTSFGYLFLDAIA